MLDRNSVQLTLSSWKWIDCTTRRTFYVRCHSMLILLPALIYAVSGFNESDYAHSDAESCYERAAHTVSDTKNKKIKHG